MSEIKDLEKELQEDYLDLVRKKLLEQPIKQEMIKEPLFLKTFRKEKELETNMAKSETQGLLKEYESYIEMEVAKNKELIKELNNKIIYEKFFLRWERKILRKNHQVTSNLATCYRVDQINHYESQLNQLIENSPEAWLVYNQNQWLTDVKAHKEQRLVSVPYVQRKKNQIIDCLEKSQPVYLVGHLGSGKTQLAIESSVDYLIQEKIQAFLEKEMEHWLNEAAEVTENDAFLHFTDQYQKQIRKYQEIKISGTKEERAGLEPLFISGSHNLTYEDMFVEKTLSLEQGFSKESFSEYLNEMVEDYTNWMEEHGQYVNNLSLEEELQLRVQIWKSFSDLFIAKNNSFGTTVKKVEREILIAIKEGRPVIVDELNTIAMQNLIALNDLLQRHVGETAYITGVGPVEIKEGFGFIGTGNLSTDLIHYEGTNQLNPAFQSRFVTVEYNYIPQQLKGEYKDMTKAEDNQLFRVILSSLANQDGALFLPNMEEQIDELFRFAQLSRLTQEVFMGKYLDEEGGSNNYDLGLKESVLSIRNIIHVLDSWNYGEEKSLSMALWEGFISSITYPNDQHFILSQALQFGFFKETEGWKLNQLFTHESLLDYEELRMTPYRYYRGETGVLSDLDIIYLLFGDSPKRIKELPFLTNKQDKESFLSMEEVKSLEEKIQGLEYTHTLYDFLNEGEINE